MRKERRTHRPLIINGLEVERVSAFKFLGIYNSDDFTWLHNTTQLVKESKTAALLPQKDEEIWHVIQDPYQFLQQRH